jgi:hypothetical protein
MASMSKNAARPQRGFMADQQFFTRYTIVLAGLILFGFLQFSMRGFVDVRRAPLLTHFHGVLMVGWLGVAVTQNLLVQRGGLRLHRKLGWVAAFMVAGIAIVGVSVGVSALEGGRQPPFFSPSYFLALTMIEPVVFAAVVAWGVYLRRRTEWHRRAMLGALVVILEPALGRVLPMPLMNGWGEWTILAIQIVALLLLARHDRKVLHRVHPATLSLVGIVVITHLAVRLLSNLPPFMSFAEALGR